MSGTETATDLEDDAATATAGRDPHRLAEFDGEIGDSGEWVRQESVFRRRVTDDGSSEFPAEPGRYHLYVSLACPWAHRTIIFRRLKKLEDVVGLTVVDPVRDERGWSFTGRGSRYPDPVNGFEFLAEAYEATRPGYDRRVTVPVLWDKQRGEIVNNESAEIIRMLNSAFDDWGAADLDFYPEELRDEIDRINAVVYDHVNDGVYKCGFATTQAAYERAFDQLFNTLEDLDERLSRQRYLAGDRITEADWRLFTTLLRFDAVYYVHFKCNLKRLVDYPNLWPYGRELFQVPGVADTVDYDHIKRHYYRTHETLNPKGIVPKGPRLEWTLPHGRDRDATSR